MTGLPMEEQMKLALKAFHKGSFTSKTACATTFDVPKRTFMTRLNGTTSRREMPANGRKLSDLEEETLSRWILSMDQHGLPIRISNVHHLARLLLSARSKPCKSTCNGPKPCYLIYRCVQKNSLEKGRIVSMASD